MAERGLITTGAVGTVVGAICCATPLLALELGALGLSAWLAGADYVAIAVLLLGIAVLGLGLYRRHEASAAHGADKKTGSAVANDCCASSRSDPDPGGWKRLK